MFGWLENNSRNRSTPVTFFCSTSSTSLLSLAPYCAIALVSATALSGSDIKSALKELSCADFGILFFIRPLSLTIFAKPSESFLGPSSTMEAL